MNIKNPFLEVQLFLNYLKDLVKLEYVNGFCVWRKSKEFGVLGEGQRVNMCTPVRSNKTVITKFDKIQFSELPFHPSPELEKPGAIGDIENSNDSSSLRSCCQFASTWVESHRSQADFRIHCKGFSQSFREWYLPSFSTEGIEMFCIFVVLPGEKEKYLESWAGIIILACRLKASKSWTCFKHNSSHTNLNVSMTTSPVVVEPG